MYSSLLVSVIIPAYNCEHTLAIALKSAIDQTYTHTEIIVIDDGSTDSTRNVVKSFPGVIYIYQENKGPSAARNTGIRQSTGNLIAFLDADDYWLPHKLERHVEKFVKNIQLGLCASASLCTYLSDTGSEIQGMHNTVHPLKHGKMKRMLQLHNLFATTTVVVRRECFADVGLFDETVSFAEDWDMWLRISHKYPVSYIDEPLCHYQRLSSGLTTSRSLKNLDDWERTIKKNRALSTHLFNKTIGYLKATSWFYMQGSYTFSSQNDITTSCRWLTKSLVYWPFFYPKRYLRLVRLIVFRR
jgi:glycosyltransferase involved in cell wall biosynthesis